MGVRDVAVLIGNPRVGVMAALCVPSLGLPAEALAKAGLTYRKRREDQLVEVLRRTAERITRSLGLGKA